MSWGYKTSLKGPPGPPGGDGTPGTPGAPGVVQSVVAGANVTVDASDPAHPIVAATGGGGGSGDMTKAVYDPGNIAANVFARANHIGTQLAATISDFAAAADARITAAIGVTVQGWTAVLQATTASFTTALLTKLNGIATGATANSPDATLLDRANHTGTQLGATISNFIAYWASLVHALTAKTGLVSADEFPMLDSAASFVEKRITWGSFWGAITAKLNATAKTSMAGADRMWFGDSAASLIEKYITFTNFVASLQANFVSKGTDSTLNGAGIIGTSIYDGDKSSGTYTPSPSGGNMRYVNDAGAFSIAAPSFAGDYTMVVTVFMIAGAGAITLTGFSKTGGAAFTLTTGHAFNIYMTKVLAKTSAFVEALQ